MSRIRCFSSVRKVSRRVSHILSLKTTRSTPLAPAAQVSDTLGVLLKYQDDIAKIEGAKAQILVEETRAELRRLEIGSE